MKKYTGILLVLFIFIFSLGVSQAEETALVSPKSLVGIEFLTGWGLAHLHGQGAYDFLPLYVDLDFDLKPLVKKTGFNPPMLVQFVVEPFIAYAYEPRDNVETGVNFLLKIGLLPQTSKFQPYFKAGPGLIYLTQHMREQSTQFNFNEYGCFGMHYFLRKDLAVTAEYRFRHVSNAGIDHPNHGVNANLAVCGVAYLF